MNASLLRYAITDRTQFSRDENDWRTGLLAQARLLAAEGVEFLQLREKDLDAGELAAVARALLGTLRPSRTRLLVNGRADVAAAVGADGVHLTSAAGELWPSEVHALYARCGLPTPMVTVSCHSPAEVERHRGEPVAAMLFGPVFEKVVAGQQTGAEAAGLERLREICRAAAPVPVFALGGVTSETKAACAVAGAAGVAGIRLFRRP